MDEVKLGKWPGDQFLLALCKFPVSMSHYAGTSSFRNSEIKQLFLFRCNFQQLSIIQDVDNELFETATFSQYMFLHQNLSDPFCPSISLK